jgi:hypothetical protein
MHRVSRAGHLQPVGDHECHLIQANDRDETWFISNRHLRIVGVFPDRHDLRFPLHAASERGCVDIRSASNRSSLGADAASPSLPLPMPLPLPLRSTMRSCVRVARMRKAQIAFGARLALPPVALCRAPGTASCCRSTGGFTRSLPLRALCPCGRTWDYAHCGVWMTARHALSALSCGIAHDTEANR